MHPSSFSDGGTINLILTLTLTLTLKERLKTGFEAKGLGTLTFCNRRTRMMMMMMMMMMKNITVFFSSVTDFCFHNYKIQNGEDD